MTTPNTIPPTVRDRAQRCVSDTRQYAAARLANCPSGPNRKYAVRLAQAVNAAADAVEQATDLVSLERAIGRMGLKTTELASLFEQHADPVARLLSVMRRSVAHVLGDDEAGPVAEWAGRLERGDEIPATAT